MTILEGIKERLDDLANAIRDSQRTPILDSEDNAKALRAALRSEWRKPDRRAHWLLSGAPPVNHSQTVLQTIFGARTKVSPQVHAMLAGLTQFSVREFMPRDAMTTEEMPPETRMGIMAHSVVTLAAKSVPKEPKEERARCLERVERLHRGFQVGVTLLTRHSMKNREAMADPDMANDIAAYIDEDMATWTERVYLEVVDMEKTSLVTPTRATDLSPVPVPDWFVLTSFLSSGMLALANMRAKTKRKKPTSPGQLPNRVKPAVKSKDCRRFLDGRCNKKNCRYRHRTSDVAAGNEPKSGDKRGQAAAATTPMAKKPKVSKASTKAKASVPAYSDSDESE
ncbi:unnamed protein product [Laminaria digitata]